MRRAGWLLALCMALIGLGCAPVKPGSPEEAFDGLISAIEAKDADQLDEILAPDFVGDANRVTTMATARQIFKRTSNPRITILSQEQETRGPRATFRTKMLVVAGSGLFPRHSARMQVDTQWEETPQGWKLRVAQWHRL